MCVRKEIERERLPRYHSAHVEVRKQPVVLLVSSHYVRLSDVLISFPIAKIKYFS